MSRNAQIKVKAMAVAGEHLYGCMADPAKRAEGWRTMWRAKRVCRRFGMSLQSLGVSL